MDGNFSAEHLRCRTGDKDVPLSAGMAFMANPDLYKAHLGSGKEITQVCSTSSSDGTRLISYSQAHAIPIRPLNKPIQVGHILMSQASEQPLAVMASLCPLLLLISRRAKGMFNVLNIPIEVWR
jgi:hypothetical protein